MHLVLRRVKIGQLGFHKKAQYYRPANVDIINAFYKVKDN